MNKTPIQWTDYTWNPLVGCRRISEGCRNCYAERLIATRLSKHEVYRGLAVMKDTGPQFTGEHRIIADRLDEPLRKRKGAKVFVNDLGDLFYEGHTNEEIAAVFGIMAAAYWHTFQVLTKRVKRAVGWFAWLDDRLAKARTTYPGPVCHTAGLMEVAEQAGVEGSRMPSTCPSWPLRNVWLGTSVEDMDAAHRVIDLLRCPASVHFLSIEPQVGPVDLEHVPSQSGPWNCLRPSIAPDTIVEPRHVAWVIDGGESGPGARPFRLAWTRSTQRQCEEAGIAYFRKQLGARPYDMGLILDLKDSHGGDESEWPADLQGCRAFPVPS